MSDATGSHRVWVDPADASHTVNVDVVNHYDNADRLFQTDGPEGTTQTRHDAAGRAYQTIDALGNATTTLYDAAGRAIQTTNPDGTQKRGRSEYRQLSDIATISSTA